MLAPALLAGYRSPFTGASGADCPVVFSGFVITNSETGCGALSLVPRLVVQVCRNGMTITRDALRAVHLGERLDEGVVTWSGNTRDKTLALITAKTTDAVTGFLDRAYVEHAMPAIEPTPASRFRTRPRRSGPSASGSGSPMPSRPTSCPLPSGPGASVMCAIRSSRRVRPVLYRSCR